MNERLPGETQPPDPSPSQGAPLSLDGGVFILDPSKRCEPNAYLFTKAVNFFLLNGYRMASDIDSCATILVNSCCVTEDKIASSQAALDFARSHGDRKRIVLLGCLASLPRPQLEREDLICIGPKDMDELDSHFPHQTSIRDVPAHQLPPGLYQPGQGLEQSDYFILVAQGCSNRCSYCNIRRAKGKVVSQPCEEIIQQVRQGISRGVKEFTLLADDCASYGHDIGTDLVQLLERLFAEEHNFRLKLGYLFPAYLLKRFDELRALFATGRIPYVNIPVQSGSQRILDLMNRRYDIAEVRERVRRLRDIAPGTTVCTHVIVNFPTESHDDFLESLAVAEDFDEVIFLHYSDNRDTAAMALHPKVPEQEAWRRLDIASEYINEQRRGHGAVISDFNCDAPYNILGKQGR